MKRRKNKRKRKEPKLICLYDERMLSPKMRNKTRISNLTASSQQWISKSSQCTWGEKGIQLGKKEVNMYSVYTI